MVVERGARACMHERKHTCKYAGRVSCAALLCHASPSQPHPPHVRPVTPYVCNAVFDSPPVLHVGAHVQILGRISVRKEKCRLAVELKDR
eukprot:349929-Chlamydomonas_euryale.AAC.8